MLQDFFGVQHLNLKIDGDGLFQLSIRASLYTSLQKHSCSCCLVAKAQTLSRHSYSQLLVGQLSSRQANTGNWGVSPALSCADSAWAGNSWLEVGGEKDQTTGSMGSWVLTCECQMGKGNGVLNWGGGEGDGTRLNVMGRELIRKEAGKCWGRQIQTIFSLQFLRRVSKPGRRLSVPHPFIPIPFLLLPLPLLSLGTLSCSLPWHLSWNH